MSDIWHYIRLIQIELLVIHDSVNLGDIEFKLYLFSMKPTKAKPTFLFLALICTSVFCSAQVSDSTNDSGGRTKKVLTNYDSTYEVSHRINSNFDTARLKEKQRVFFASLNPIGLFDVPGENFIIEKKQAITNHMDTSNGFLSNTLNWGYSFLTSNSSVSGVVRIESYVSNKRLPYQLSEPIYTRVYATPKVSLLGIPFNADVYYTTEDNTFYNSNSFGLHFDPSDIRNRVEEKAKSELKDAKKRVQDNKLEQERLDRYLSDIQHLLKSEMSNLSKLEETIGQTQAKFQFDDKQYLDSMNRLQDNAVDRVYSKKDSLTKKSMHRLDSSEIAKRKTNITSEYDQRRREYEDLKQNCEQKKQQINELLNYYNKARQIYDLSNKRDSIYNLLVGRAQHKKDSIQNSRTQKVKQLFNDNQFIQSIQKLDLGNSNPYFSENSLSGISVRGLNTSISTGNRHVQITGGKTLSNYSNLSGEQVANIYNRNVVGLKLGFGQANNQFSILATKLWDPLKGDVTMPKENLVTGIDFQFSPLESIRIKGEFLASSFNSNRQSLTSSDIDFINLSDYMSFGERLSVRSSINVKVSGKIDEQTNVEVAFQQKKLGFNSLGTPFHRRDYRQSDIKIKRKLFNKKIHVSVFHKNFVNNLSETSQITNSLKGLGYMAYSSFSKKPNFQITHLPFEQGNNHQDTLFRTNNRLSTTIVGINYRKTYKFKRFFWLATYTKSAVEYFQLNNLLTETRILLISQNLETSKLTLNTSFLKSNVTPRVDTLNFNGINVLATYKYKQHRINASIRAKKSTDDNGMYIGSLGYGRSFKRNLNVKIDAGVRYINGFWGMENLFIYQGRMSLTYTLNKKPYVIVSH